MGTSFFRAFEDVRREFALAALAIMAQIVAPLLNSATRKRYGIIQGIRIS